jgi:hypothetical protein
MIKWKIYGSGHYLFENTTVVFHRGAEENHDKLSVRNAEPRGQEWNMRPPEHEVGMLAT